MVGFIKAIDSSVGSFTAWLLSLFAFNKDIGKIEKVACVQLWSIGETILTLPAIASVAEKHDVTVICTVRNKEVYEAAGLNVKIIALPLHILSIKWFLLRNFHKYDLVIDFEEYLNISAIMAFFLGKSRIGFHGRSRGRLYTNSIAYNDKQHVSQTFLDLTTLIGCSSIIDIPSLKGEYRLTGNYIGISPGVGESAKSRAWPKEKFVELIDMLHADVVLIGGERER